MVYPGATGGRFLAFQTVAGLGLSTLGGNLLGHRSPQSPAHRSPRGGSSEGEPGLVNCHILPWKDPPFVHGKIHYFDWAIFNSFLYVHQRVK